jgi:membrane protease YdiL (CAAX protease family)
MAVVRWNVGSEVQSMGLTGLVRRFPLAAYFALVYAISALALVVIGPPRSSGAAGFPVASLVMFPVMVVGVAIVGIALTAATAGRAGLRDLGSRLTRLRARWLPVVLIPPVAILAVLELFRAVAGPSFTPGFLAFGIAAGVLAGFFEEIGWTGFAYPRMRTRFGALGGALLLGVLWGLWHFPVVDSLGAASPHGMALPAFFASFVAVMTALRVLIAWVYANTGSVLMAQLLHASSTGFLVVLSAPRVTPAQEALWYLGYALVLWAVVAVVVARWSPSLAGRLDANGSRAELGAAASP